MTPQQIAWAIRIGLLAVLVLAGFGAGWMVNGWRLSGKVERLQGAVDTQQQSIETLMGVNESCHTGLADVKGAVKAIAAESEKRSAAAAAAMQRAEKAAGQHLAAAREALGRPLPAPGKECETVAGEAAAYAKKRRAAP